MIAAPGTARIWIATGHADMRKGMPGLALLVQEHFKRKPFEGKRSPEPTFQCLS
jgi:transposase